LEQETTPRNLAGVNAEVIAGGQRGWEADLRGGSVFAREYPSSVFARVVRHRLAIRKDRVRIILPPFVLDIYRGFLSVFLATYCTRWRAVIVDIA